HKVSTYFGGHLMHQSTQQQKVRGNSRLRPLLLQYPLTPGCVLEIQPLANGLVDQESWSTTHRVELVRIVKEGAKLI
ncbi:hypothetical protein, partial [Mesorhizobium sp. M1378]|uniref:hypothetical protein n=1 Tax=Mesorhizobium sp. M1378 TaxID=2957092 RepID=UPI00333C3DDF